MVSHRVFATSLVAASVTLSASVHAQGQDDPSAAPASAPAATSSPSSASTATSTPAASSTPSAEAAAPEGDDRTLAGHTFIYPILQQGAFNTSHFGIRQGAAFVRIPALPLGALGSFDLTGSGLTQAFDVGVKIIPWLGVYGTAEGQALTGGDVSSAVLFGGSFVFRGEGGAVVRIARLEKSGTQFAARVFGGAGTGRDLKVLPVLSAVLGGGSSLGDVLTGNVGKNLITPKGNNTFGASLHAAQAVGKLVGLQAAIEGRSSRETATSFDTAANGNVELTTSTTGVKGAIGAGVDGNAAGFPFGGMAEYQLQFDNTSSPRSSESAAAHLVSVGLYYTGQRHLLLGIGGVTQLGMQAIEGQDASGATVKSGAPSLYYGQFVFRYVW